MPVFHTKTIEAILDPVAQQVRYFTMIYQFNLTQVETIK